MPQQRLRLVLVIEASPQQRIRIRLDEDEARKGHGALKPLKGGTLVDVELEEDDD